jgi:ferredoxin
MAITRVWIEPGCISCHYSEATCPAVFHVGDQGAVVRPGADLAAHEQDIRDAAEGCPVQVIRFEGS